MYCNNIIQIKSNLDEDCGRVCIATPKDVSSHHSQSELRLSQVKGPQLDRTLKSFKHRRGNFNLKETLRLITEQKAFIRFLLFLMGKNIIFPLRLPDYIAF